MAKSDFVKLLLGLTDDDIDPLKMQLLLEVAALEAGFVKKERLESLTDSLRDQNATLSIAVAFMMHKHGIAEFKATQEDLIGFITNQKEGKTAFLVKKNETGISITLGAPDDFTDDEGIAVKLHKQGYMPPGGNA